MLSCFYSPLKSQSSITSRPVHRKQFHHRITIASFGSRQGRIKRSIQPLFAVRIAILKRSTEVAFLSQPQHGIDIPPFRRLAVERLSLFCDVGAASTVDVACVVGRLRMPYLTSLLEFD